MGTFFSFLQKNGHYIPTEKKIEGGGGQMRPPYWLQKRTPVRPETEVLFRVASVHFVVEG